MESSPAGQLSPKNAHTVSTIETCNSSTCCQPSFTQSNSIEEPETIFKSRDAVTNSLRDHMRQLVHLYKKIVNQAEENRFNYWVALQELDKYKQLSKISHKTSRKCKETCNKEMNVNLCSINGSKQTRDKSPLPRKISKSIETRRDQLVVVKKRSSEIKIQLAINTLTKGACACTEDSKKSTTTKEVATTNEEKDEKFVDVKDSITKILKEANENLKKEVAALKQQLQTVEVDKKDCGEGDEGDVIIPIGKTVSLLITRGIGDDKISIEENPLQNRVNELELENQTLKEKLDKALEDLQNKKEMEAPTKEEVKALVNDGLEEPISIIDPDLADRLEEMYMQTKVNSKLINEIFWKLDQIQQNMQTVHEVVHGQKVQEPLIERRVSHLESVECPKTCASRRRTDGNLFEEKDLYDQHSVNIKGNGVQVKCDVATNCISFCLCTTDHAQKGRCSFKAVESSFRSTELRQHNLDVDSKGNAESYKIVVVPVRDQQNNDDICAASCNEQLSNTEIKSASAEKYSQYLQQSDAASNCSASCNELIDRRKSDDVQNRSKYDECLERSCPAKCNTRLYKTDTGTKPLCCTKSSQYD